MSTIPTMTQNPKPEGHEGDTASDRVARITADYGDQEDMRAWEAALESGQLVDDIFWLVSQLEQLQRWRNEDLLKNQRLAAALFEAEQCAAARAQERDQLREEVERLRAEQRDEYSIEEEVDARVSSLVSLRYFTLTEELEQVRAQKQDLVNYIKELERERGGQDLSTLDVEAIEGTEEDLSALDLVEGTEEERDPDAK